MKHNPIIIKNLTLSITNKDCFADFSAQINAGEHIAIIGCNGCGKSSLLKIFKNIIGATSGKVIMPNNLRVGYIKQVIDDLDNLSGGQRVNKKLSTELSNYPDLLLLDEPSNHLDTDNRRSLIGMLQRFNGTLIIASHDKELMNKCTNKIWHIDNAKIHQFTGSYDDYLTESQRRYDNLELQLSLLKSEKKKNHQVLMKEQSRAKKRKAYGEKKYHGDKNALRGAQAQGEMTSNKNNKSINRQKQDIMSQMANLYTPKIISPKFSLSSSGKSSGNILSISNAEIGYHGNNTVLQDINLAISARDKVAINGNNGSGKSTLIKAILHNDQVIRTGNWHVPHIDQIGYLDQHYSNIDSHKSVLENLQALRPDWCHNNYRVHLNDFLFCKNEEIANLAANLSGGERARISLCLIAAKTPKLLILDEITNNLDLDTKDHVIQILREYPATMIIISHEEEFIKFIGMNHQYIIENGEIHEQFQ